MSPHPPTQRGERAQAPSHNLPTPPTLLIGREQDVKVICQLLEQAHVRLLTLTGSGGVGKTRVSLQVAHDVLAEYVDGVYFVPLAPITDPDLVIPAIAQA